MKTFVVSVFAVMLGACAASPTADTGQPPLRGFHWNLASATDGAGQPIVVLQPDAGHQLRLVFDDGRVSVSGGCNRMSGSYLQERDTLSIGAMAQTEMACNDQRLMEMDSAIGARLHGELQSRVEGDYAAPRLSLVAANGDRLTFEGMPTAETRYGGPGETMFLEVAAQRVPCAHPLIPNKQCLQVRERQYDAQGVAATPPAQWQPLYQDIEGYEHHAGERNVLRVKRFDIRNPPTGAPSVAYVLDMVVESEIVPAGDRD